MQPAAAMLTPVAMLTRRQDLRENEPAAMLTLRLNMMFLHKLITVDKTLTIRQLFSRVHATLHPALSVRRSVRRSVGPSVRRSVRHTLLFL